ncbi:MAG: hypothetical protein FJ096_19575 [Deltaproteobacteria bacterium]|nr:hypothetical protein [Deltaproteobacteria bacterium]
MGLSERLADLTRTPTQRTVLYVGAFGLGSLAICAALSWIAVGAAEALLPRASGAAGPRDAASASSSVRAGAGLAPAVKPPLSPRTVSKTPGSKAAPGRGNDSPPDSGD